MTRTVFIIISLLLGICSQAQDQSNQIVPPRNKKEIKRQRKLEKKLAKDRAKVAKDSKKREAAEYVRAKKRHMAIQSPETRQRMKMRKKNAGKNFGKRKPSLWKRLFGRKKQKYRSK